MAGKHARAEAPPPVDEAVLDEADLDEADLAELEPPLGLPAPSGDPVATDPPVEPARVEPAVVSPAAYGAAVLPGSPRTGRQAVRAERRQKTRRTRLVAAGAVVALVLVAVAWAVLANRGGKPAEGAAPPAATRTQGTLLLQVVDSGGQTVAASLLAHDSTGQGTGFGALVPSGLLVQSAGLGAVSFGSTSTTGGAGTGSAALSDALGVIVDGGWLLSQTSFGALIDSVGGVDVNVDEDIQTTATDGGSVLLIKAGQQHLSGTQAAAYATHLDAGAPEQARLARFSSVLSAMLAKLPPATASVSTLLGRLGAGSTSTYTSDQLATFLDHLRSDATGTRLTFDNIPTHPLDASGSISTVVVDNAALPAYVKLNFAGSLPKTSAAGPITALVQNGVGTPGLDETARIKLTAAGISYIGGNNASSFDNPTSSVLIADDTDASRAKGTAVAKALGLPTSDLKITGQGQNVADVVVVLGADYKP
jgi:hypothetical protein